MIFGSLILASMPSIAVSKIYKGEILDKFVSVKIVPLKGQIVFARASQRKANIAIELHDSKLNKLIRVSDVDPYMMLDEIMFVEPEDCKECEIRLVAKEFVAQRSPYHLEVEIVDGQIQSKYESEVVRALSFAVNFFHESKKLDGEQKKQKLSEAIHELESIAATPLKDSNLEIWLHSRLILAEVFDNIGRSEDQIKTLENVRDIATPALPVFSIIASYQLAASIKDEVEINKYYESGIENSRNLNDLMFVAIGKSYHGVHLVKTGYITKGTQFFTEALSTFVRERSWHYVLPLLYNMSWAKSRAGDMTTALAFATQAKLVAQQFHDEVYVLWSLYSMGIAYGELGQNYHAGTLFDEAILRHGKLSSTTKNAAALLIGYLHQDKARVLMYQGAYDLAWDSVKQAIERYRDGGYDSSVVDGLFVQGEIALARSDFKIAHDLFSGVIAYDRENNRSRHLARHLLRLSELQTKQGKHLDASLSINEAVKLVSHTEDYITLGEVFSQLINVLYHLEAYDEALYYSDKFEPYLIKYNSEHDRAIFYYRKALAAYAKGNRIVTQSSLDSALYIVDRTLPKVVRKDLVQSYIGLQKSLFELNLKLFLDKNPEEFRDAINIVERHRARTLKDSITRLNSGHTLNNEQSRTRGGILTEIQESAAAWYDKGKREDSELLEKARALSARMGKFEAQVLLAKDKSTEPIGHTIEVNWQARPDETILYYFVGQEKTWLWAISGQEIVLHQLPGHDELELLVGRVLNQISIHPANRRNVSAWELKESLASLSETLLLNILDKEQFRSNSSIVVIADGPLHGFPFGVLAGRIAEQAYLVDKWSIEYAPSLQTRELFSVAKNKSTERFETAMVVMNPKFSNRHSSLKYSANEADLLKKHLGAKVKEFEGAGAQKKTVLNELKSSPSILHIATHGLINSHEPALSGLLFSGERGNQMWLAPEISDSSISADLVFLSACESASGKYVIGEGLMSLSRAFFEAGASSVIGTLWKVQDDVSAALSKYFYQNLFRKKMSVSEALQRAQKHVRQADTFDWSDPYFWAAYQYQGASEVD